MAFGTDMLRAAGRVMDVLGETKRVKPQGAVRGLVAVLSVIAVIVVTWLALFGIASQHLQVSIFLVLMMPMAFLTTTAVSRAMRIGAIDWALALVSVAASAWFAWNEPAYAKWMTGFTEVSTGDMIAGTALVLLTIELCRRTVGFGLTLILLALLAYAAFGYLMSGPFRHGRIDYPYFLEMQTIGTDGIFGSPLYVAASYAFLFILFGNFYVLSGGGQLFFDLAAALTGRMVGGPAKACVVSSGLYGSISG